MIRPKRAKLPEAPRYRCRDCAHSYDWHEKNWLGQQFLCRCTHYKDGKYSKFLDDPQCGFFEMKKEFD